MGEEENAKNGAWFIARQDREPRRERVIDFWSKPLCDIDHAGYLPPEFVRGALWYDSDASQTNPAFKYVDSILDQDRSSWWNNRRLFVGHRAGIESLSAPLLSMVGQKASPGRRGRTALLALDSLWLSTMDPDWAARCSQLD